MVKDASGAEKEWSLEMGAPMYLYANGWRPEAEGRRPLNVTINPLRNGEPGGIVLTATTADGRKMGNNRGEERRTAAGVPRLQSRSRRCPSRFAGGARRRPPAKLPDWWACGCPKATRPPSAGCPKPSLDARGKGTAPANNPASAFWLRRAVERRRQAPAGRRQGDGNRRPRLGLSDDDERGAPIQFFITRDKVMIVNGYRDVTDVRMGEPHPSEDDLWPTVWGDTIGHWEGDTLVIDTIAVKTRTNTSTARRRCRKAHYVQRIRIDEPDHLVDDMTIEDPTTLTLPWTVHLSFMPAEGLRPDGLRHLRQRSHRLRQRHDRAVERREAGGALAREGKNL